MKTNKKYTVNFRNFGEITVPAGTKVTHKTACGIDENYHFVDQFAWIEKDYPKIASILKMDVESYGINVPKEYIDYDN